MKVSKSGLFLFELIVVIFLFTISSAICISIFAKSYTFSTDSENLTVSSMKAETVAEVFKKTDGDIDSILKAMDSEDGTYDVILTESEGSDEYTLNIYFDKQWRNTDEYNSVYVVSLVRNIESTTKTGQLLNGTISVKSKDKDIIDIETKKYISGNEAGDDDE